MLISLDLCMIFAYYSQAKYPPMRQRFEQQLSLRTVAIHDVEFPLKSRDELPPVLKALQYIFITAELNEKVFVLLEKKISAGKRKTGRKGMDLWHILVLAVVRHTLNTNWDRLHDTANYHQLVRSIMGIYETGFNTEKMVFEYQCILDNVSQLDEDFLGEVNQLVVEAGHKLLKKKQLSEDLRLKTDSYVLETNVHFPTDLNLLYDALRKCLDRIEKIQKVVSLRGWRKIKYLRKVIKSTFRSTSHQVYKGKSQELKINSVQQYLNQARQLTARCQDIITGIGVEGGGTVILSDLVISLMEYTGYALRFIDLTERRLIQGERIPAEDKIYSIFEPHTEWITKGKINKRVELGHLLLITTDQHSLIVDYKVMEKQRDALQIQSLTERLKGKFNDQRIYSHSFDKGFYSKANLEILQQADITQVILPKRGKLNQEESKREGTKQFRQLRDAHSAIESNINMLEHHGLNRCADKGIGGYKKYVGLSVLAYNLHILGRHLINQEKLNQEERLKKQAARHRRAA